MEIQMEMEMGSEKETLLTPNALKIDWLHAAETQLLEAVEGVRTIT